MPKKITSKIERRLGDKEIIEILSNQLSGSELNSLLLEVFAKRKKKLTAAVLLKQYEVNRFVHPAETDYIRLLEKSIATLKVFSKHGFSPLHLSPLSPFGSCSVLGPVDQDKIVTALRNTEVLSDATNTIALFIGLQKKKKLITQLSGDEHIKYSSVQRHVRAQPVTFKGFSPHFTIGCIVSSGIDTGNYVFEKKAIADHFKTWEETLGSVYGINKMYLKLQRRGGYAPTDHLIDAIVDHLKEYNNKNWEIRVDDTGRENSYYQGLQFKVVIEINSTEIEIADGGFVNWTQQLLSNKKERMCISGFGLELLNKFEEGLI